MTTISPIWKARWKAVDNIINILMDRQRMDESGSLRKGVIGDLLGHLQQFGRHQFYFFYDGLGDRHAIDLLDIDAHDSSIPLAQYVTGYSITEHILRVTINQLTDDISVIQRASEQRQASGHEQEMAFCAPIQEDVFFALGETDRLALSALRALAAYIPNAENTTAITYFHKSADVRVIPYMPVAMIGVPVTAVGINDSGAGEAGVREDLLAIPHEVGHYLYWNGEHKGERFYILLERTPVDPLVAGWVEEIFADVTGCLVGGAAATLSFMELLLGSIGNRFITTTDVHPTPALRPYLYFRVLDAMGQSTIATELRAWWEGKLKERMIFPSRPHLYAAYAVVDSILALISPKTILSEWQWSDACTLSDIYENFFTHKDRILSLISIEDLDPPTRPQPDAWSDRIVRLTTTPSEVSALTMLDPAWLDAAESLTKSHTASVQIAAKDWLRIFESSGWTTGGPHWREP